MKIILHYVSTELINDINETIPEELWEPSNGDSDVTILIENYKTFLGSLSFTVQETYFHALVYDIPLKEFNGWEVL